VNGTGIESQHQPASIHWQQLAFVFVAGATLCAKVAPKSFGQLIGSL
jgi:hypothetical protein